MNDKHNLFEIKFEPCEDFKDSTLNAKVDLDPSISPVHCDCILYKVIIIILILLLFFLIRTYRFCL